MAVDPKKATPEQLARAFALLEKEEVRKEKIARGEIKGGKKWSELTDKEKQKFRDSNARRAARMAVKAEKAEKAGITVSDKEIDEYLAKKKAMKK